MKVISTLKDLNAFCKSPEKISLLVVCEPGETAKAIEAVPEADCIVDVAPCFPIVRFAEKAVYHSAKSGKVTPIKNRNAEIPEEGDH